MNSGRNLAIAQPSIKAHEKMTLTSCMKLLLAALITISLQLTEAWTLPLNANCSVGGPLPNTPCAPGLQCVLYNEGEISAGCPALGNCRRVNRNTCFDKSRGVYFAPGTTLEASDCGRCTCPVRGGVLACEKCILEGGTCTIGGRFRRRPLDCSEGLECVLFHEGNIRADGPAVGTCQKPTGDTCYDHESGLLFAPRTPITLNSCSPCRCAPKGGKIECETCVLEGGNCTIGGFFAVPPPSCKNGLMCILYDEGYMAADTPAHGNCYRPTANMCLDRTRGLYFQPKSNLTNRCGPCRCPSNGGRISCKVPVANCRVDPCLVAKCPRHPSAICVSNRCRKCSHQFYIHGVGPVSC